MSAPSVNENNVGKGNAGEEALSSPVSEWREVADTAHNTRGDITHDHLCDKGNDDDDIAYQRIKVSNKGNVVYIVNSIMGDNMLCIIYCNCMSCKHIYIM